MTVAAEQYPFVVVDPTQGPAGLMPCLPLTLGLGQQSVKALAILDTAAAVNVLPYQFGVQLGANWDKQTLPLRLTGNLAAYEAKALMLQGVVGSFPAVRLAFAWTRAGDVPLLLGNMNFFMEFDVCFFRAQSLFEIKPKQEAPY